VLQKPASHRNAIRRIKLATENRYPRYICEKRGLPAISWLARRIGSCTHAVTRSTNRVDESLRPVAIYLSAQIADDDAEYDNRVTSS
jgi:hypothetical protein